MLVQQTDNDKTWAPVFYNPENCLYQEFGKGQWNGTGHRIVSTMFDLDNAPYSNMVMGEVFNQPGRWSSYPPHHHPQPELYYYQFDHSEGFGAGFEGDIPYKTENGSCLCIRGGNAHQQVTAPGYEMYYVWLIRHLDGDPWIKQEFMFLNMSGLQMQNKGLILENLNALEKALVLRSLFFVAAAASGQQKRISILMRNMI